MSAVHVRQDGIFTIVELTPGLTVDVSIEQSIYRQRKTLFEQHKRQRQRVIYMGEIKALDMGAARFACSKRFADITLAKAMVLRTMLTRTYANMMLELNKPDFPVLVCESLSEAKQTLMEKFPS